MAKRKKHQLNILVLRQFRMIFGAVRHYFREVEQTCGVSGSQLWILQEVARTPWIGISELADRLSIHQSTCSQLVEKLSLNGLIVKERSKEDQRRVGLVVSVPGAALLKNAPGPAEGLLPDALSALSEEVLEELDVSLSKVIAQLQVRDERFADKPLSEL